MELNIAIVGLGRVGSELLEELLKLKKNKITVVAVAEKAETEGLSLAKSVNVPVMEFEDIARIGESLDIIFEVTGVSETRSTLRSILQETKNSHTVIASETIVYLLSMVIEDMTFHHVHDNKGYEG